MDDWNGDPIFDPTFDPYGEMQRLKVEVTAQRQLINNLITANNNQSDLLVQLSNQNVELLREMKNIRGRLARVESDYIVINKQL